MNFHVVRFLKRAIATTLILLHLVTPAHADLANDLQKLFGNQIKQTVSQQLASIIGIQAPNNPAVERALTALMSQKANTANLIFDSPLNPHLGAASASQANVDIYDPSNLLQTQKQIARWKAFVRLTSNKAVLTESDLTEAANSLLPFFRYYAQGLAAHQQADGNFITVAPGAETAFSLAGYCMDRTTPAPTSGEKLQLVPITQLVPESALPVYQAMMQFSAANIDKRSEIQNLVWGLRHAADPYPPIKELNSRQNALLNEAMPNGAQNYINYLSAQSQASKATEAQKQLYRTLMGGIQSKLNITLPDATKTGYSEQDTNTLITALTRMPVEGVPQAKSEYSLLADGVAAKTIASNLHKINVQIRNTTDVPFTFDANSYAGQSTRVTQRVAFGGVLEANAPSGPSAVQRLQDVLQKLEIAPLKRLQAQIQQLIDRNAGLAGDGRLKLAGLALATAMNAVLLPTSVLDVALLSPSKLVGAVGKLTAREIGAVEAGLVDIEKMSDSASIINSSSLVQNRIESLLSQIPKNTQGRITMGVAVVENKDGIRSVVVSTSEPRGYIRPGVVLQPGETIIVGTGHAEADIVSYANANGLKIIDIGATRPVCSTCQDVIRPTGANITTPLK